MMTGDDVGTARTIAEKCGIISRGDKFLVLEGRDLNKRTCSSDGQVLNTVRIVCALIHVFGFMQQIGKAAFALCVLVTGM